MTVFETLTSCVSARYTLRDDGDLDVLNRAVWWPWTFLSYPLEFLGSCDAATGKCKVGRDPSTKTEYNYEIIDTDYTSYTIIYSCESVFGGLAYQEYMWFLAREPHISASLYESLVAKMKEALPHYWNWYWRVLTWQGTAFCWGTPDYTE